MIRVIQEYMLPIIHQFNDPDEPQGVFPFVTSWLRVRPGILFRLFASPQEQAYGRSLLS